MWRPAPWLSWLTPGLAITGLVVAGYLSYIETQSVQAICGPVGECNVVQTSSYARLFGVLPLGILGMIGYVLILTLWLIYKNPKGCIHISNQVSIWLSFGIFSIAFLSTAFSLYLTYLELFIIRAICVWCLASAVIMALILLFNLKVYVEQLKNGGYLESQNEP